MFFQFVISFLSVTILIFTILDKNVSPIEIALNIRLFYFLFFFHCLIGSIGALVAANKGYNRLIWLLLGLLGGTLTFFVSLTLDQGGKNE